MILRIEKHFKAEQVRRRLGWRLRCLGAMGLTLPAFTPSHIQPSAHIAFLPFFSPPATSPQAARKKAEELLQAAIAAEMDARNKLEDVMKQRQQEQRLLDEERAAITRVSAG